MIGYLIANGISSQDYGIYLTDGGTYNVAERDVSIVKVPGRNGDLVMDNKCFKNVNHSYKCVIPNNFGQNYRAFVGMLLSFSEYIRIEDSFNPDEYILAQYKGETKPKRVNGHIGSFELKFSRKPQRFLKEGELPISFTSAGTVYNENMPSKPLVRVYGTGNVGIGDVTIKIISANEYTDIDCDSMNAYKGTTNCNGNIQLMSGKFFELETGNNGVSLGTGITKIEIIPRWWRL